MAPPVRPENVLKRAEELVDVEKPADALDLLYDTLMSKRSRGASLEFLEPVVLRLVDLAVQLRRGKVIKDSLHQFRKLATPQSLEKAVERLLTLSEARVAEAQSEAEALAADDDLEEEQTPQDVLMATVSAEQTKDRADREMVTPWLKFLWENFRAVLDVLRNNAKLETVYAPVVAQAFQFCLRFQRKTEFRRLCDLLRNHLAYAAQQSGMPSKDPVNRDATHQNVDLSNPDTLQRFLDTRFEQLHVAVKLELWQEAFRSIEDVHTLLTASRRPIRISNMATYYETLARIFSVAGNHLFHAAAWAKYYAMVWATRHSAPDGEIERIASFLVLSVLCIPPDAAPETGGRASRWGSLLNLPNQPTREALLETVVSKNALTYARPEIRELFVLVERRFHPLTLAADLNVLSPAFGRKAYASYMRPLYHVLATRLISELSQVYTKISLDRLGKLATLPQPFGGSSADIERLIITRRAGFVDHKSRAVEFVPPIENELQNIAETLTKAVPPKKDLRSTVLQGASLGLKREYDAALRLRHIQSQRDEERIAAKAAADQQALKERAQRHSEQQAAEAARVAAATREREMKRLKAEQADAEREFKRKLAEDINAKGVVHVDMNDLDSMTQEDLQQMQVEQLERESRDLRTRMRTVSRRYDHLERAYRRTEAKLWIDDADSQAQKDRKDWELRQETTVQTARTLWERDTASRKRYSRMLPAYESYLSEVESKHAAWVASKRAENSKLLEEAKAKRVAEHEAAVKAEEERRIAAKIAAENAAKERAEREEAEEKQREAAEKARAEARASRPSPFGAASRSIDSQSSIAAAPRSAEARPSPFGAARPVSSRPPANVSSSEAKHVSRASPFGSARPVEMKSESVSRASPFGSARPTEAKQAPAAKSSPFGSARPTSTGPRASPFGAARPVNTADSETKSETPKFVPSWKRKLQQQQAE